MNRNSNLLFAGLFLLFQQGPIKAADSAPPDRVAYQGYLVDSNGTPLGNTAPSNYEIIFRIYDVASVTEAQQTLWSEQQTVTLDKGNFSVLLGAGSAVGNEPHDALSSLFTGADISDRFVGITVSGLGATDTELSPRLRLVTASYSFLSAYALQADKIVGDNGDVLTNSGGNIGIGNASPDKTLDVGGDIKVSEKAQLEGQLSVGKLTAPTAALDVVGTIKSSAGLDVLGNSSLEGTLSLTPTESNSALMVNALGGSGSQLSFLSDSTASYIRSLGSQYDLRLGTYNSDVLTLKPDGRVGIGTPDPSETLDVDGTMNVVGDVKINGSILSTGKTAVDVITLVNAPYTNQNINQQISPNLWDKEFVAQGDTSVLWLDGMINQISTSRAIGTLSVVISTATGDYTTEDAEFVTSLDRTVITPLGFNSQPDGLIHIIPINRVIPNLVKGTTYYLRVRITTTTGTIHPFGNWNCIITHYNVD